MIQAILTADSLPMIGGTAEYVLMPEVILLLVEDGTSRLLNLDGCFSALPAIGTLMLQQTLQHGVAAAAQSVSRQFDVEESRVRADLNALLHELERWRYITRSGSSVPSKYRIHLLTGQLRLTLPLIGCIRHVQTRAQVVLTLVWLSFALFGWSRTIDAWRQCFRSAAPSPPTAHTTSAIAEAVRTASARHLLKIDCKEQALGCWALCRQEGVPASLVLGIQLHPLASHCWCELEGQPLTDDPERCERFIPLVRYDA